MKSLTLWCNNNNINNNKEEEEEKKKKNKEKKKRRKTKQNSVFLTALILHSRLHWSSCTVHTGVSSSNTTLASAFPNRSRLYNNLRTVHRPCPPVSGRTEVTASIPGCQHAVILPFLMKACFDPVCISFFDLSKVVHCSAFYGTQTVFLTKFDRPNAACHDFALRWP